MRSDTSFGGLHGREKDFYKHFLCKSLDTRINKH